VIKVREVPPESEPSTHGRPVARFVAESAGGEVAEVELIERCFPHHVAGHLLQALHWEQGYLDAAFAVVDAALRAAPDGTSVHLTANAEVHQQVEDRIKLAVGSGFQLLQEKKGVWWEDDGRALPLAGRIVARPLTEVGPTDFAPVIAQCMTGTLDRIDRAKVAEHGARGWADMQLAHYLAAEDAPSWVLAHTPDGQLVGFAGLSAFDEEQVGTISHIGVLPEQRGKGYVDQLLRLANLLARGRGFRGVLSDVDVLNLPMLAAMGRAGHSAQGRLWHRWHYVKLT
jgi:ribosomal protein S18 acetylase RimI-like enzyme